MDLNWNLYSLFNRNNLFDFNNSINKSINIDFNRFFFNNPHNFFNNNFRVTWRFNLNNFLDLFILDFINNLMNSFHFKNLWFNLDDFLSFLNVSDEPLDRNFDNLKNRSFNKDRHLHNLLDSDNLLNNPRNGNNLLDNLLNNFDPGHFNNLLNNPIPINLHNFRYNFLNIDRNRLFHFHWHMFDIPNNNRFLNNNFNWSKMFHKVRNLFVHDHQFLLHCTKGNWFLHYNRLLSDHLLENWHLGQFRHLHNTLLHVWLHIVTFVDVNLLRDLLVNRFIHVELNSLRFLTITMIHIVYGFFHQNLNNFSNFDSFN